VNAVPERQFLVSVFLMEAWDTLAEIEEHAAAPATESSVERLLVLTHRLRGAAGLNGFSGVAALASAMEAIVEKAAPAPADERDRAAVAFEALIADLKAALDAIAAGGEEDTAALIATATTLTPAPEVPAKGPRLDELARFFAENRDVLEYFGPEAAEHLDAMTASLLKLERAGASDGELAALFRAVHTLKGAAYTVGCRVVGDLAHRIEDLLGAVRESQMELTPAVVEAVFAGTDALRGMLASADGMPADLDLLIEQAKRLLDAVPVPPEAAAVPPTAVGLPAEPPAAIEQDAAEPQAIIRPSIRVNLDRLDALMNLVGELVIARSRLERRLSQFEHVNELLLFSQSRMTTVVRDFERKYLDPRIDEIGVAGGPPGREPHRAEAAPAASLPLHIHGFDELEFDRYDDFNILARSIGEISSDVSEIEGQLAAVVRGVRDDTAQVQRLTGDLRRQITRARMVPVGRLFTRVSRQVREAARAAGKTVTLELGGETVEMDNTIIEQIADPLLHLIQNAITHGVEPEDERLAQGKPAAGTVRVRAYHKSGAVYVEVADDGRGIDVDHLRTSAVERGFVGAETASSLGRRELLDLIFLPGFSTAASVTTAAGRGVGMDVVRTNVTRLGGDIEVDTEVGTGTRFTIKLPLTIAIADAFLIEAGGEVLAVPVSAVQLVMRVRPDDVRSSDDGATVIVEGEAVEFIRLRDSLGLLRRSDAATLPVLILRAGRKQLAVAVDHLLGKEEIVIKSLGAFLEGVGPYSGATISGEGRVILLLDAARLADHSAGADVTSEEIAPPARRAADGRRVLLVDDSISIRKFVGQMLQRGGFSVVTANDGVEALQRLGEQEVDVLVTDLEMPRLNGYELIRDVRRRPAMRDVPVLVLTTRAGEKHAALARELGVSHYVTKPVDEHSFVRLVDALVARSALVSAE
jgi:chemosensory pili system protein ChpA (sensor histidine kinase/response regulator)